MAGRFAARLLLNFEKQLMRTAPKISSGGKLPHFYAPAVTVQRHKSASATATKPGAAGTVSQFGKGLGKMEQQKYKDLLIVPDIIDAPPKETCDLVFPSGAKAVLGNELQPADVREAPRLEYTVENGAFYSVVIADADTQNPEKNEGVTQWQQWVVVNVPGKDVPKGDVLSEYMGSGPLPGTGLHRYVALVFKQNGKVQPKEPYFDETEGDRKGFNVRSFIKKYGLSQPVAGNFYQAKFDESVRELYNEKNSEHDNKK